MRGTVFPLAFLVRALPGALGVRLFYAPGVCQQESPLAVSLQVPGIEGRSDAPWQLDVELRWAGAGKEDIETFRSRELILAAIVLAGMALSRFWRSTSCR